MRRALTATGRDRCLPSIAARAAGRRRDLRRSLELDFEAVLELRTSLRLMEAPDARFAENSANAP